MVPILQAFAEDKANLQHFSPQNTTPLFGFEKNVQISTIAFSQVPYLASYFIWYKK